MFPRSSMTILLLTVAINTTSFGQPDTNAIPLRLALLVGVEKYQNLAPHEQLAGCVNDTRAMSTLLIQRFGFLPAEVVTLNDEAATGATIRQELSKLVQRVHALPADSAPAQIVFHFSGHGSQVADQVSGDAGSDEQDGLDETLVPCDATTQGGSEDIRDDEVFAFADQICHGEKARVWLLLDCCHSGTGARGTTRFRSLERGSVLPLDVDLETTRRVTPKRLPDGAVLLSACRASEKEPEYQDGTLQYGLLTRFVTQILNQETAVSQLSYDALCESLVVHYRQAGVTQAPTPQLEGARSSIVLGATASLDRQPFWKVSYDSSDQSMATVHAGSLHGITTGSLFELYDRPDQIPDPLASTDITVDDSSRPWLRIEQTDGVTSMASVFRWKENEQVATGLPPDFLAGYAVERVHEHGDFMLRMKVVRAIDVDQDSPALAKDDPSLPQLVRNALAGGRTNDSESPWLVLATDDAACDVVLRIADDHAAVFPSTGNSSKVTQGSAKPDKISKLLKGGWGPIDLRSETASADLMKMLRQINRVRNLMRIVAQSGADQASRPQVKLELVEIDIDSRNEIIADRPWTVSRDEDGQGSLIMRDGSIYTVRITNTEAAVSGHPVYVTVLHVDADMGIDVLIPYQQGATEEQLLLPGESRLSGPFQCNAPGDPPIHGRRTAIMLATREPNDFYVLASASLPVTRGARSANNRSLDDILIENTYFRTRGGTKRLRPAAATDNSWTSSVVQWIVLP
ncbi:MAG: caspase family protein [Planctomycetaceae bacterium]|nr:caspase family protein [Planctomycetaceae bacterium]